MRTSTAPSAPGTRERLLDAAERRFAARGFSGTSVREITEAAGAHVGAVNYHFRSKAGLYTEVFARLASVFREPVAAAARQAAPRARAHPEQAFEAVGRAFLASHENRRAALSLIGLFAREAVEPRLPGRFAVREFLAPTIDALASVVRHVRPDLPESEARGCAHAFLAQLMHLAKGMGASAAAVDERLDHAVRFTVAAVTHLPPAPAPRPTRAATRRPS